MAKAKADNLTAKQEDFALAYVETGNAAEAYRRAYDVKAATQHSSIYTNASKLLSTPKVRKRVADIQKSAIEACKDVSVLSFAEKIKSRLSAMGEADVEKHLADCLSWLASRPTSRGPISGSLRYRVFEAAGFKCQACGRAPKKCNDVTLHVDHIIPLSLGGLDVQSNMQCLCSECNLSKGNKSAYNHNVGWDDGGSKG